MPRARTKGDRIQIQLPLDVDASVRAKALKDGTSPSRVIEDVVTKAAHSKIIPIGAGAPPATTGLGEPVEGAPIPHTHRKAALTQAGLHACSCGAIRGVDGEWR